MPKIVAKQKGNRYARHTFNRSSEPPYRLVLMILSIWSACKAHAPDYGNRKFPDNLGQFCCCLGN
jgi:hypothetical protein